MPTLSQSLRAQQDVIPAHTTTCSNQVTMGIACDTFHTESTICARIKECKQAMEKILEKKTEQLELP